MFSAPRARRSTHILGLARRMRPDYDRASMDSSEANWRAALWTGAGLLCLGPIVGIGGTIAGMARSFRKIEGLQAPTPKDLAQGVYESTTFVTLAAVCSAVGALVFFVALCRVYLVRPRIEREHAQESDA